MKCPYCAHPESKVVDSRPSDEGASIRRRRECLACHKRFTTYETMESLPLVVIKKDGSRQTFDKSKLLNGMIRAWEKRPVPFGKQEEIANEIEQVLQNDMVREIPSAKIGELVMDRLREVDEVAYVRFASVYRQFKDIGTFMTELNKLLAEKWKQKTACRSMYSTGCFFKCHCHLLPTAGGCRGRRCAPEGGSGAGPEGRG